MDAVEKSIAHTRSEWNCPWTTEKRSTPSFAVVGLSARRNRRRRATHCSVVRKVFAWSQACWCDDGRSGALFDVCHLNLEVERPTSTNLNLLLAQIMSELTAPTLRDKESANRRFNLRSSLQHQSGQNGSRICVFHGRSLLEALVSRGRATKGGTHAADESCGAARTMSCDGTVPRHVFSVCAHLPGVSTRATTCLGHSAEC